MSDNTEMQQERKYLVCGFDYDDSYREYIPVNTCRFSGKAIRFTSSADEFEVENKLRS